MRALLPEVPEPTAEQLFDLIDRDDGEAFVSEEEPRGLEFLRDETAGDEGWRPF